MTTNPTTNPTGGLSDTLIAAESYAQHPHLQAPLVWQALAQAAARGYPVGVCTDTQGVGVYITLPSVGTISWPLHPHDLTEPLSVDRADRVWQFAAYERATRANGLPYFTSAGD